MLKRCWNLRRWWRRSDLRAFWQRGQRGWADRDTWSLDNYLAGVIAGSVAHLRDHNMGYPASLPDSEHWVAILDRIARGWQDYHEKDGWDAVVTDDMRLLLEWYGGLWD